MQQMKHGGVLPRLSGTFALFQKQIPNLHQWLSPLVFQKLQIPDAGNRSGLYFLLLIFLLLASLSTDQQLPDSAVLYMSGNQHKSSEKGVLDG